MSLLTRIDQYLAHEFDGPLSLKIFLCDAILAWDERFISWADSEDTGKWAFYIHMT